ncbi:pain [Trypoxylus dichotomus]
MDVPLQDIPREAVGQSEPIHLAVKCQNPQLLEIIVNSIQNPDRLNATEKGSTALNLLIKYGKKETTDFMKCLRILLSADGIDVNKADNKQITPILWACVKGYKDVIEAILEAEGRRHRYVDIDTHTYKEKTARNYIQQHDLCDGNLNTLETNENIVRSALWYVENKNEKGFFTLREIDVNDANEEGTLLQHACNRNLVNVVKYLVNYNDNVDVQQTTLKNRSMPLKIAAYNGHDEIFEILLPKYDPIPKNILTMLLTNVVSYKGAARYKNCLNALLDNEKPIPVNERSGPNNTPLHYACRINDPSIPLKLLKKGANLANKNDFDFIAIEYLDSKILEQHFDDCIEVDEYKDKQNINVTFDYTTILPTVDKEQVNSASDNAAINENLIEETVPSNETDVIRVISETPELRRLLIHPLIASFIRIKWHALVLLDQPHIMRAF